MKCSILFSTLSALVLVTPAAFAAGDPGDEAVRIKAEVEKRIDRDPSTAGMVEAIDWEIAEWDRLMNEYYSNLLSRLPKSEQNALRKSQRAWIAFRDLETATIQGTYGQMDGTMYRPMAVNALAEVVKARATQLGAYLRLWTQ